MTAFMAFALLTIVAVVTGSTNDTSQGNTTTGWVDTVWDGIRALKNFTLSLKNNEALDVLGMFEDTMKPCFAGWELFFKMSMWFRIENQGYDDKLDEMKMAYGVLNEELERIEEYISAVKEEIDWDVVEVEFTAMETSIRRMGEKLAEVLHTDVDQADGRKEYIRVYDEIYKSSGLGLYDSIVNNYHVPSENLLQAAIKYSKSEGFDEYLKGLIAILMRASAVEIAYEQFSGDDRSMSKIWEERMMDVKHKMAEAINDERDSLLGDLEAELDSISSRTSSHLVFVNDAYSMLMEKYWWRSWFVLAYDYGKTSAKQTAFQSNSTFFYQKSHYYNRDYMVCSTENREYFNATAAALDLGDKKCPSSSTCATTAKDMVDLHADHGVGKFAIDSTSMFYAVIATEGRFVSSHVNLKVNQDYKPVVMFYFG